MRIDGHQPETNAGRQEPTRHEQEEVRAAERRESGNDPVLLGQSASVSAWAIQAGPLRVAKSSGEPVAPEQRLQALVHGQVRVEPLCVRGRSPRRVWALRHALAMQEQGPESV